MLIKICARPKLNQPQISNWSVRPNTPDRIWYVRQNVPIRMPVITLPFVRFSPLAIQAVETQGLHANDACLSWTPGPSGPVQQRQEALFCLLFLFVYDFLHTPWAPLPSPHSPHLFGLEYPVGTFHSLFSLLQEVRWRGMRNGPQNCCE